MNIKKLTYKHTLAASYLGYITQAAVNNLAPLLFTAFCRDFGVTLGEISLMISANFITQIVVDAVSVKFLGKTGMRRAAAAAHFFGALGFILMGTLPFIIKPFYGLMLSMIVCAVGGGLTEVVISPIVEAIPGDEKASAMSMLHSFYCWGQVGVVVLSTLYFTLAGTENWRWLPLLWVLLPAGNMILFMLVPINSLIAGDESPMPLKTFFGTKFFYVLLLLMVCAGASELAMSQWSSYFAESSLRVSKTAGDLLGPCGFALLMGTARLFYGINGSKIPLEKMIKLSCVLCIASYMTVVFSPVPVLSLIGCAVCGFSVGILWPGTFSIASREFPRGGEAMFALLALAGDLGCSAGPLLVGAASGDVGDLKRGLFAASVFPLAMLVLMLSGNKHKADKADDQ